jgi:hypothetical protein
MKNQIRLERSFVRYMNHGYATLTHTPHPTHLTSQGRSEREREREKKRERERDEMLSKNPNFKSGKVNTTILPKKL